MAPSCHGYFRNTILGSHRGFRKPCGLSTFVAPPNITCDLSQFLAIAFSAITAATPTPWFSLALDVASFQAMFNEADLPGDTKGHLPDAPGHNELHQAAVHLQLRRAAGAPDYAKRPTPNLWKLC